MVTKAEEPKNEVTTDIKLTIEEEAYIEMMKYAHEFSPDECSGVGLVERIDFNDDSVEFNVKKVFLPLQSNTGSTTDISDEELNKLNTQLVQDGEDTSLLKFHWHSHVDMSVFHSGTDDENYDDMKTGDYAVSLVVNKRYDMLGSVHLYDPLRINVLNIEVEPPDIDLDDKELKIPAALRKKIEENVQRVKDAEEEERKKNNVTIYRGNTSLCSKCHKTYFYCSCYDSTPESTFGNGLEVDRDLYALLEQGEKAGLIHLFYDDDNTTIVGYMNQRTNECFELISYLDYCNYGSNGIGGC
jgi:hypothetical protein